MIILISREVNFRTKTISRDKEGCLLNDKEVTSSRKLILLTNFQLGKAQPVQLVSAPLSVNRSRVWGLESFTHMPSNSFCQLPRILSGAVSWIPTRSMWCLYYKGECPKRWRRSQAEAVKPHSFARDTFYPLSTTQFQVEGT